jgi:hypothetical protein
MISVSIDELRSGAKLRDGDVVQLVEADGPDPNNIDVSLVLDGVTWWKGIQAQEIVLCQCQDSQNQSHATLPASQVQDKGLQLWKAKLFGAHTPMYEIANPRSWAQGGKVYTFVWSRD